jgi:hypothetical protein
VEGLRAVGQSAAADAAASPSIWPAVSRQIRESRRDPGRGGSAPRWFWAVRTSLAASLLALVAAASFGVYQFHRQTQVIVRPWPPVIALRARPVVRPATYRREIPATEVQRESLRADARSTFTVEEPAPVGTAN